MVSIIDCRLPTEQFALAHTATVVPGLHVAIERLVAQSTDSAMSFVWVNTDDVDTFETAVAEDSSVDDFSELAEVDGERFYRMHLVADIEDVLQCLRETNGRITTATLSPSSSSWEIKLLCPHRESVLEIYECCTEKGLSLTVDSLHELNDDDGSRQRLTELQRRRS